MAKMKKLMQRIFHKDNDDVNLKLRKAVMQSKPRQVAMLLDQGASPTWMSSSIENDDLNALLLACQRGNTHILNLLLDAFFQDPCLLNAWARQMYCVVIRHGHWKAFLRLQQRNVPLQAATTTSLALKLPAPAFMAAECGQHQILHYLLRKDQSMDCCQYEFNGHTMLSIASTNGHYECVEVLLRVCYYPPEALAYPIQCARLHRQAHVLVLLTSCLPQYSSSSGVSSSSSFPAPVSKKTEDESLGDSTSTRLVAHRGSLAETDLMSDSGDEERRSSSLWIPEVHIQEEDEEAERLYHESLDPSPESTGSNLYEGEARRKDPNMRTIDGFAIIKSYKKQATDVSDGTASTSFSSSNVTSEDDELYHSEVMYPFELTDSERQRQAARERLFQQQYECYQHQNEEEEEDDELLSGKTRQELERALETTRITSPPSSAPSSNVTILAKRHSLTDAMDAVSSDRLIITTGVPESSSSSSSSSRKLISIRSNRLYRPQHGASLPAIQEDE